MNLMRILGVGAFLALAQFTLAAQVFASDKLPLSEQNVEVFLQSVKDLESWAAQLQEESGNSFFVPQVDMLANGMPLYVDSVIALKLDRPEFYKGMQYIVSKYNDIGTKTPFTPEGWAENVDRVILVYFSIVLSEMNIDHTEMMSGMTSDTLSTMSLEEQTKARNVLTFTESLQEVSEVEKSVVKKYEDEIGEFIRRMMLKNRSIRAQ